MNMKLESKELLEVIKTFDDYIEIPLSIAHTDVSKYRVTFDGIKEIIKNFNDTSDPKDRMKELTRLSTHLLRLVDEMIEDNTKRQYKFTLELKKKNYIIRKGVLNSKMVPYLNTIIIRVIYLLDRL